MGNLRIVIEVPAELKTAIAVIAARQNKTMKEVFIEMMTEKIKANGGVQ